MTFWLSITDTVKTDETNTNDKFAQGLVADENVYIQYLFLFSLVSRCLHFVLLSLLKSQYKLQKFAQFTKILRGIFASGILNILQQLRFSLLILLVHSCFNAYTLG